MKITELLGFIMAFAVLIAIFLWVVSIPRCAVGEHPEFNGHWSCTP